MFSFKYTFAGEVPNNLEACQEHAVQLERIGREIVDLLRHHGYLVNGAMLDGIGGADLIHGTPKSAPSSVIPEEVTRNERKPGTGKASR